MQCQWNICNLAMLLFNIKQHPLIRTQPPYPDEQPNARNGFLCFICTVYAFILYADVAKNLTLPNSDYLCLAMT